MPEAAPLAFVALSFLITWVVLYGMTHGVQTWLSALLNALAHPRGSLWKRIALLPVSLSARAIAYVVHTTGHAISQSAAHGMQRVAHWLGSLTVWASHNAIVVGNFAEETARGFERLAGHTIPRAVAKAIAVPIHEVQIGLRHTERELAQLRRYARGIDTLVRDQVIPGLRRIAHAVDVTLPRSLGRVRARVGAAERSIANPSHAWIKRIWHAGWILVGAGLMLKFLVRKFPWLFCRNTTAAAKAVCGMDSLLLDALLLETLALTGTLSVVTFTEALLAIEGEAMQVLSLGIEELGEL